MTKKLSDDIRRILDAPNFAHLATLMEDGSPKVEPVWIGREENIVFIVTHRKSIKAKNMDRDARVAISVTALDNPYEQVLIRGKVIEIRDDNDMLGIDKLAHIYLGTAAPRTKFRPGQRVLYAIEPSVARYYLSDLKTRINNIDGET